MTPHNPLTTRWRYDVDTLVSSIAALRPLVDAHITPDRVLRYLSALADTPAPSTAASAMRAPVLRSLLQADGAFTGTRLTLDPNFGNSGSAVAMTGDGDRVSNLWYFAHLDTISYLVQPRVGARYPLVPFCYHLIHDGVRPARAYRYELANNNYSVCAEGEIISEGGIPYFRSTERDTQLRPGDRVVPVATCRATADGTFIGHVDNAGGVAALAVAAPVLAQAGVAAMLAFPDEEEGPLGTGSQVMGRGGSRIVGMLPPPDLAIIADVQQAGGDPQAAVPAGPTNTTRLGQGAVLSEFSSLARGAVTPPHLYALASFWADRLVESGVKVQESNNAYTSRSDDVSVLLKTPNILLLGFPGFNRHFDRAVPSANLFDIVDLAKSLVYASVLRPALVALLSPEDPG
jgi:hypothetical protein